MEDAAFKVERAVRETGRGEISSKEVGELVMDRLREIDDVAYVRFASVYREFRDLGGFRDELERILAEREGRK